MLNVGVISGNNQPLPEKTLLHLAERRQALVIIPDSTHLASDLESLVKALIDIEVAGGDVRCANFDAPDAVQDGLEKLVLPGRRSGGQRRIQEAIMAKAARGQVLGRVPFGYRGGPDGMMHPVSEEAEVVGDAAAAAVANAILRAFQAGCLLVALGAIEVGFFAAAEHVAAGCHSRHAHDGLAHQIAEVV